MKGARSRRFRRGLMALMALGAVVLAAGCATQTRVIPVGAPGSNAPNFTPDAILPSVAASDDGSVVASPTSTHSNTGPGPKIDVWYGPTQTFGTIGIPQQWINIVGNVSDPSGVASLGFSFDGGQTFPLTLGPDDYRLVAAGDFNVALEQSQVPVGTSTITLHAINDLGNESDSTVTIHVAAPKIWPLPYTSDWTKGITVAAQVVDGRWVLTPQGVRTFQVGYDRVLDIGDQGWLNYNATVPFIINGLPATSHAEVSEAIGWTGHDTTDGNHQPLTGHSFGGLCALYRDTPTQPMALKILGLGDPIVGTGKIPGPPVVIGQSYTMAFQAKSVGNGQSLYQCKVWPTASAEPTAWQVSATLPSRAGSMLLVSDEADVTFGNVTVTPVT